MSRFGQRPSQGSMEGHTRTRLQRGSAHGPDAAAAMDKWKVGLHAKPINGIPQLLSKSDVHDWNAAYFHSI